MQLRARIPQYVSLMRLDKPIGILLLLWPTLWALWLASGGWPSYLFLFVFTAGTVLMRSAGCVVNDVMDRRIDGKVRRTCRRPLVIGSLKVKAALGLAAFLSLLAFMLVLFCNSLTIGLAIIGGGLTMVYPLMKRFTSLPQVGLGVAFSWSVPMAFAAVTGKIEMQAWFLFFTCMVWPVIYDTMYAMVDREDDQQIGVRSTAILFGLRDRLILAGLQVLFLLMLVKVGTLFHLSLGYISCIFLVGMLFLYQQWLIRNREPDKCFAAFLNNNWVGLIIFIGIYLQ
jgi:4-hydroxybenzoate polyprenyltransferase